MRTACSLGNRSKHHGFVDWGPRKCLVFLKGLGAFDFR